MIVPKRSLLLLGTCPGTVQGIGKILLGQRSRLYSLSDLTNRRKVYKKKSLAGFSDEQLYSVVSDVSNYEKFLPFCSKSLVYDSKLDFLKGDLVIGFPPLTEKYTSHVTLRRPSYIRADCMDGRLFNHFLTTWNFNKGLKDIPQSCVIDIDVQFEFKSAMYSKVAHLFFDQVVNQMEEAFLREAKCRFGTPVIKTHILSYHSS